MMGCSDSENTLKKPTPNMPTELSSGLPLAISMTRFLLQKKRENHFTQSHEPVLFAERTAIVGAAQLRDPGRFLAFRNGEVDGDGLRRCIVAVLDELSDHHEVAGVARQHLVD